MEYYLYFKALHIIFVVTWFSGLFYVPRIFIYIIEAQDKETTKKNILTEQLSIMVKRLWFIITWPSAILALAIGIWMIIINPSLLSQSWLHIKLSFIVILLFYHLRTHKMHQNIQKGIIKYKAKFMRLWNEIPTLLIFAIVFIVVLKNTFSWVFGVLGILALGISIILGIRLYKNIRKRKETE